MTNKIQPFPYQAECLEKIDEAVQAGAKRALVVMASGLGKTYTSAFAVEKFFAGKTFGRVLVLCHSEAILKQTRDKFKVYFGKRCDYGMFTSQEKTVERTKILFATFQTLKQHRTEFAKDEFAYVIVDEAHHSYARTYYPTVRYFEPDFLLGLTATPDRLDGQKITEIFGEPVYELGFVKANAQNLMTKCDYRLLLDDLSQEKFDEYVQSKEKLSMAQLNRTLFIPKRDEEIVRLIRACIDEIQEPKTMIFCRTITHAKKIARLMGKSAALVYHGHGETSNEVALSKFRQGQLRIIVSVQMLNEGIDVPDANHIVFLRNTVSPALFYQQLGRGTRLAAGKEKVIVQDFVANCERVQEIIRLQHESEDFRVRPPKDDDDDYYGGGEHDETFTLNITTPEFKTRMVDIVELLERAAQGKEWTDEEIIAALQRLAKELGRTPTSHDLDGRDDMPSSRTVKDHFGSMNNAIIQAGLVVTRWIGLSKEEAIRLVMSKSTDGIMPLKTAFDEDSTMPHSSTIILALGVETWAECAEIVDLKIINTNGMTINESQREALMRHHLSLYYHESLVAGHWLTVAEINSNPRLNSAAFYEINFGSMHNVRERALALFCTSKEEEAILTQNGKESNNCSRLGKSSVRISDQYIVDGVIRLTYELRRKPTRADIDECDYLPCYEVVRRKVGGINKLDEICRFDEILKSIDLSSTELKRCKPRKNREEAVVFTMYTDGSFELKESQKGEMQEFVRKNRRRLRWRDLCRKNGLPSATAFQHYHLNIDDINRMIGADEILTELAQAEEATN